MCLLSHNVMQVQMVTNISEKRGVSLFSVDQTLKTPIPMVTIL